MKSTIKGGILVVLFSIIFLLIFPAFLDNWPTIFGIACVFLFIPLFVEGKDVKGKYKLILPVLVCAVNLALILYFCDQSIVVYQVKNYLAVCAACFTTLFLKRKLVKH